MNRRGDDRNDSEPQIRSGLAVASIAAGIAILVVAWHLGVDQNPLGLLLAPFGFAVGAAQATFFSGLLVNIGTTVLLAVLLIMFERTILRRVQNESRESEYRAERAAEDRAEAVVAERVKPLETRLTNLDALFQNHQDETARARRRAASALLENSDFDSFANKLSAIASSGAVTRPSIDSPNDAMLFIVPAGDSISSPRVEISYGGNDGRRSRDIKFSMLNVAEGSVSANWNKVVPLQNVLQSLSDQLVGSGAARMTKAVSPDALFRNVALFLDAAAAGRNGDTDAWLTTAPAHELVFDGWIITENGVEARGHGVIVPRFKFGRRIPGTDGVQGEKIDTDPPLGVDEDIYAEAVNRARPFLLSRPFPGRASDFAPRLPG